ncbi:aldehyde ferredoxin oxidoreductase family protein [Spirochaetota bacterium]
MTGPEGTILYVDLGNGKVEKEALTADMRKKYAGGRGINVRILLDEVAPGIDALSEENALIFGTGVLSGTSAPAPARFNVTAKSPLTGIVGDSNAGGHFGPALKRAGIDHLVLRGRADKPVYLWIDDGKVELRSAGNVWGKNIREAEEIIKDELGDKKISVAAMGQAGENLVRLANVIHQERSASRTGMGAVMGSKNLKALAVRGTKDIYIHNPEVFKKRSRELTKALVKSDKYEFFKNGAASAGVYFTNNRGMLGVKNYQMAGGFPGIEKFDPKDIIENYFTGNVACFRCPIACGRKFKVKDGLYAGEWGVKIEEGAFGGVGPVCGNDNINSIFKMNNMGNQLGIDLLEFGHAMAVLMELQEKGIVTPGKLDGISMDWGNYESLIKMMEKVAFREGIGDILAEGIVRSISHFGKEAEDYISHSKGMSLPPLDPRMMKGSALALATSTRGADHLRSLVLSEFYPVMSPEDAEKTFGTADALNMESYNKASAAIYYQHTSVLPDLVEICRFLFGMGQGTEDFSYENLVELFRLATGIDADMKSMFTVAERVYNMERAFACREGMDRKDDRLIGKWGREPVPSGPFKGEKLDGDKWEIMLDDYYRLRGWDENGVPTKEKLNELGIDDVAESLEKTGAYNK